MKRRSSGYRGTAGLIKFTIHREYRYSNCTHVAIQATKDLSADRSWSLKNVKAEQHDYLTKLQHDRDLYLTETYLYATPRRNIGSIPLPIKLRPRVNLTYIRRSRRRVPFSADLCGHQKKNVGHRATMFLSYTRVEYSTSTKPWYRANSSVSKHNSLRIIWNIFNALATLAPSLANPFACLATLYFSADNKCCVKTYLSLPEETPR